MEREPRPTIPGMYCPLIRGDCVKGCRFMQYERDPDTEAHVPKYCMLQLAATAIKKMAE